MAVGGLAHVSSSFYAIDLSATGAIAHATVFFYAIKWTDQFTIPLISDSCLHLPSFLSLILFGTISVNGSWMLDSCFYLVLMSLIYWQLEPLHMPPSSSGSFSELIYLWFLRSMTVGHMNLASSIFFFSVTVWMAPFSILSVNIHWRLDSCLELFSCYWSTGS